MSAASATSSSTSATSSTSTATPEGKRELKGNDKAAQVAALAGQVVQRITEQTVNSNLQLYDISERRLDREEAILAAMSLKRFPTHHRKMPEDLQFSKEDISVLNELFDGRALSGKQICLNELVGLDCFEKLMKLEGKEPKVKKLRERFCLSFFNAYSSGGKTWLQCFAELKEACAPYTETHQEAKDLHRRIGLWFSLFKNPHAAVILDGVVVRALQDHLPQVAKLEDGSAEKIWGDIRLYGEFYLTGIMGVMRGIGHAISFPEVLLKGLSLTVNRQNQQARAIDLKRMIADCVCTATEMIQKVNIEEPRSLYALVQAEEFGQPANKRGRTTFSKALQMSKSTSQGKGNKSTDKSNRSSVVKSQMVILRRFSQDLLNILDMQILHSLSPDTHIPVGLVHNRTGVLMQEMMNPHSASDFQRMCKFVLFPTRLQPPTSCSDRVLSTLFGKLRVDMQKFIVNAIAGFDNKSLQHCFYAFEQIGDAESGVEYLHFWRKLKPYFSHSNIEKSLPKLKGLSGKFYKSVIAFLQSNSINIQHSDTQEKWIAFFREWTTEVGFDLVRYFMSCQDIPALCVQHVDPKLCTFEELFPNELIDFMNCEGLIQLLTGSDKSSQGETPEETKEEQKPEQKGSEASAASASQTTTTSSVSQQQAQRATSATSSASQSQAQSTSRSSATLTPLELRRFRKRDELIKVLQKEIGLTKEEGAKHTKMRDSEGNVVTIISRGSSDIPKGTMQSITQQVLHHVSQTSASQVSSTKSTAS